MKEVFDFASSLQRAAKTFLLYGSPAHPKCREATENLIDHTEAMLRQDRVQIAASRGSLFVQGQLIGLHNPATDWLIEQLAELKLNGFVINKGVTAGEIAQIIRIFTLKAGQLEDLGGPAQLFSEIDATHVRVSQTSLEEVRDGEIVIPAEQRGTTAGGAAYDPTATLDKINAGTEITDEETEQLAKVVSNWILAKRNEIRPEDPGDVTSPSARGEMPAEAGEDFGSLSVSLADFLRAEATEVSSLQKRLSDLGISRDEVEEILEVVAWENLAIDERVEHSLQGSLVFDLPIEKILSFISDLLNSGRHDDAGRLIEKLGGGLFSDSLENRKTSAERLQRVVGWVVDPGLTPAIEASLERMLLTHFAKEWDPQIQRRSQIAFMKLHDSCILRGQIERALQTLRKIETIASAASSANPWKRDLFDELIDRLTTATRMAELLDRVFNEELWTVVSEYHPLLTFFGGKAAVRLLDALEIEEDRSHRGRIIKAIKAIGNPALEHLESALQSPTWYLVRNALNVLGDLRAMELIEEMGATLSHEDDRVKRAAARALGKLGGLRVERYLADALKENGAETQIEVLIALAGLKAESVIGQVVELTRSKRLTRADDPVRLQAIETLGAISSDRAVGPLAELLKKKGMLTSQEPLEVRKAVCSALLAIGTPQAMNEVRLIAETEQDSTLRTHILQAASPQTD